LKSAKNLEISLRNRFPWRRSFCGIRDIRYATLIHLYERIPILHGVHFVIHKSINATCGFYAISHRWQCRLRAILEGNSKHGKITRRSSAMIFIGVNFASTTCHASSLTSEINDAAVWATRYAITMCCKTRSDGHRIQPVTGCEGNRVNYSSTAFISRLSDLTMAIHVYDFVTPPLIPTFHSSVSETYRITCISRENTYLYLQSFCP